MEKLKKQIGPLIFISSIITINAVLWVNRIQASFLNSNVLITSVIGSTTYIAVNGVIYDVTNNFTNSQHLSANSGETDAT